ncbi:hypothetical protein [Nocardioides convexus]|uniref:hypothetical protein n=1 Tax=Nocardioides convexus TaxID=2712224 RepID=UPI00241877DC|nr:hypothetical protein [Nocardioides convexus]
MRRLLGALLLTSTLPFAACTDDAPDPVADVPAPVTEPSGTTAPPGLDEASAGWDERPDGPSPTPDAQARRRRAHRAAAHPRLRAGRRALLPPGPGAALAGVLRRGRRAPVHPGRGPQHLRGHLRARGHPRHRRAGGVGEAVRARGASRRRPHGRGALERGRAWRRRAGRWPRWSGPARSPARSRRRPRCSSSRLAGAQVPVPVPARIPDSPGPLDIGMFTTLDVSPFVRGS